MGKKLGLMGGFLVFGAIVGNPYVSAIEDMALKAPMPSTGFKLPSAEVRYDQVCWLATHNAYAAERYGYIYANQYYKISEQLQHGVRAFELDIYKRCWSELFGIFGSSGCTVSMCHGVCDQVNKWIYQPWALGTDALGFVSDGLAVFKQFLEANTNEIITLTLENYVTDSGLLDSQIEASGIQYMVLKPSDWDPVVKKGWPTLQWMIQNNKRLVIFNDQSAQATGYSTNSPLVSSTYTYYQWTNVTQNQWGGALDMENTALLQRASSQQFNSYTRYLLELDWFADGGKILGGNISELIADFGTLFGKETPFVGDYGVLNGPSLINFINAVLQQGLKPSGIAKGRYPNFIKVDYFHEGNPAPLNLVNQINQIAADPVKREQMFEVMW